MWWDFEKWFSPFLPLSTRGAGKPRQMRHAQPSHSECLGDRVGAGCGPKLRAAGQGLLTALLRVHIRASVGNPAGTTRVLFTCFWKVTEISSEVYLKIKNSFWKTTLIPLFICDNRILL